jgi:hypothetical protein
MPRKFSNNVENLVFADATISLVEYVPEIPRRGKHFITELMSALWRVNLIWRL